ncbi:MAG TPA: septal ring lytic transglycosylase RlpA family protein [Holophaga sp.]|nr:septal ring lytic transglycosylase RlpA family protein [Holophaga sp.]
MRRLRLAAVLGFAIFLCREASGLAPLPPIGKPVQAAVASWYGKAHEGRRTASGAIFRRRLLTAAHRTARFGTRFLVLYQGRAVEVLVNDRGPFARCGGRFARDLDLSEAAATCLGLTEAGAARVLLAEPPLAPLVELAQLLPRRLP